MNTPTIDQSLREIFASPEYAEALKQRLINGQAKPSEIALARSLGLWSDEAAAEQSARAGLQSMDSETRSLLMDLLAVVDSPKASSLRIIQQGDFWGIGMPSGTNANVIRSERAAGVSPTDTDLMPRR